MRVRVYIPMALDRPTGHTVPIALEALPETCRLGASIVGPCAPAVVVLQLQCELHVHVPPHASGQRQQAFGVSGRLQLPAG